MTVQHGEARQITRHHHHARGFSVPPSLHCTSTHEVVTERHEQAKIEKLLIKKKSAWGFGHRKHKKPRSNRTIRLVAHSYYSRKTKLEKITNVEMNDVLAGHPGNLTKSNQRLYRTRCRRRAFTTNRRSRKEQEVSFLKLSCYSTMVPSPSTSRITTATPS